MAMSRRSVMTAGFVGLSAALAGCTADSAPAPRVSAPRPTRPTATVTKKLLTFTEIPLALPSGSIGVLDGGVHDGVLLLSGEINSRTTVLGLDPTTGASRWSYDGRGTHALPKDQSLIGDVSFSVGSSPFAACVVYVNPCASDARKCSARGPRLSEGYRVVAVDGTTGQPRWNVAVIDPAPIPAGERSRGERVRVVAANDRDCVLLCGPYATLASDRPSFRPRAMTTRVLDSDTGAVRWTAEQFSAHRLAGPRVLGYSPLSANLLGPGAATVRDSQTGVVVPIEGLPAQFNGQWVSATDTHALVQSRSGDPRMLLVDLSAATVVRSFPRTSTQACVGTGSLGGGTLMVWDGGVDRLSWAPGEGEPRPLPLRALVDSVHAGVIYAVVDSSVVPHDRDGAVIGDGLPARPLAWTHDRVLCAGDMTRKPYFAQVAR